MLVAIDLCHVENSSPAIDSILTHYKLMKHHQKQLTPLNTPLIDLITLLIIIQFENFNSLSCRSLYGSIRWRGAVVSGYPVVSGITVHDVILLWPFAVRKMSAELY
jgi:hypothetical protein